MSENITKNLNFSKNATVDKSRKPIPLKKIVKLYLVGLSYQQIAKIVGCSLQNCQQRMKRLMRRHDPVEYLRLNSRKK